MTVEKFYVGPRAPLCFIHIPKTAGTSMRHFLTNQYQLKTICPAYTWHELADLDLEEIRNYSLVQGHFGANITTGISPEAKTLVVLRNPLNRTLSSIRHLKRDPAYHRLHYRARDLSIAQILRDPQLFENNRNDQTARLSARSDVTTVVRYLRDGTANGETRYTENLEGPADLNRAKETLEQIDYVGVVENLDEFVRSVAASMGFHPPTAFPHDNDAPGGASDYAALSDEEIDLLRACNDLDLELYAYAERLMRRRQAAAPVAHDLAAAIRGLCERGIYRVCNESFEIDLSGPIPGTGWHDPETGTLGARRWTGPQRYFSLELPLDPNVEFRMTLNFTSTAPLEPSDLQAYVDDFCLPIGLKRQEAGNYLAEFDMPWIPSSDGVAACRIVFEIPSVFSPSLQGKGDLRKLGILVRSIVAKASE